MSTSQDRDYLTSLPTELLIKVIAKVPIDSYLDLAHTSKGLRDFMKANAAGICNEAIRRRHSVMAEYLKTELKSGWLVPTHQGFDMHDEDYLMIFVRGIQRTKLSRFRVCSLLGEYHGDVNHLRTMFLNVKSPGPQFLHFLERKVMIYCEKHRGPQWCDSCYEIGAVSEEFQAKLNTYWHFLDPFNSLELEVKNGKIVALEPDREKIPRAMLWYYGLDKLVLT